jgi:hypothetical protein
MYINLHGMYPLFLSDLVKLECFRQIFRKYSDIKFHDSLSSGSRVPCIRTNTTKLMVAFRNFTNALKFANLRLYTEWNWNLQSCARAVATITRAYDRACTVITQFTDTLCSTTEGNQIS